MIDAMRGQDVATDDIQGDFLKNDYGNGDININTEGEIMTLLVKIDPAYFKDFIYIYIYPQKIVYSESKTSIYSTLEASLLFWTKLSKSLEEMGYNINEYDWCIMNKMVKGKQCNIIWHMDYLRIFHVDCDIVSTLIYDIDTEHGKFSKITITQGKIHT